MASRYICRILSLQQVITNEHVVAMVKNTILATDGNSIEEAAHYEPKMTRSKVKDMMNEDGDVSF